MLAPRKRSVRAGQLGTARELVQMQNLGPPHTSLWIGDLHFNKVPGQAVGRV